MQPSWIIYGSNNPTSCPALGQIRVSFDPVCRSPREKHRLMGRPGGMNDLVERLTGQKAMQMSEYILKNRSAFE
jgi:hypothetical protein